MSHVVFWPTVAYFYPVGNTSAVSLTENLSPESKAHILLLACGDPRHVLCTIYADENNSLTHSRVLDITCCDIDPTVIARNTLLFTLLADRVIPDKQVNLWDIFYHMFIDKHTLSVLFEQCRKLVPLAESMESWRAGPYGHFITMCDSATLTQLRCIWTTYLDTASLPSEQAKTFEQRFKNGMKGMFRKMRELEGTATASCSAGPLALDVAKAAERHYDDYWTSGITGDSAQEQEQRLTVNPLFAFSVDGERFMLHYGTDPLIGFHLAEVYASGESTRSRGQVTPHDVVSIAKDQFSRWCASASKRLKDTNPSSRTFVLRMFAGDALSFCQALKYCEEKQSLVTPFSHRAWWLSTITLDDYCYGRNAPSPAPLSFNVIDTSNSSDHVGLVNILVVTAPLLCKTPFATLHTEVLFRTDNNPSQAILKHFCGDLPTIALLLGIIPSTCISQFTTHFNAYETMTIHAFKPYHERLAWKPIVSQRPEVHGPNDISTPPQHICFSPEDLAIFFYRVYLHMFADENSRSLLRSFSLSPEQLAIELLCSGNLHYNRRSFVLLVRFVKTRIHTDWQRAMSLLEDMIIEDKQLMSGRAPFQELYCQFQLLGVYTAPWQSIQALFDLGCGDPEFRLFRDWTVSQIPQIVTLVLVVPREAISNLEPDFSAARTLVLQCDILDDTRQNNFGVISATFGTLHISGTGEHRTGVVIEADTYPEAGVVTPAPRTYWLPPWRTRAEMIVTFSVPSSVVLDFSRKPGSTVGLTLRMTPWLSPKFTEKLGVDLTVFRTGLVDTKRVFVLARPPVAGASTDISTGTSADAGMAGHFQDDLNSTTGTLTTPSEMGPDVHVRMNDRTSTIRTFTLRIDVTDPSARAVLADAQTVPTVISGSSIGGTRCFDAYVRIGAHAFPIQFPLPVDVTRAKLRVARRSSYVEIVVPPASFDVRPERDLSSRFSSSPVASNDDGTPTLGCIHRINLDKCPPFKLPKQLPDVNWCYLHLALMFSKHERTCLRLLDETESPPATTSIATRNVPNTLLKLKRSLRMLLGEAAGAFPGTQDPRDVFALEHGTPYLYIIVARMRLDVGSHTIVADAFVAEATSTVRMMLHMALDSKPGGHRRAGDDSIRYIRTDRDETEAWFHLIPRLTERCRTRSHKATCEYRQGTPKRDEQGSGSSWEAQDALCTCGLGVGTEILPKHFQPLAPYLTRAAFSPLFPVPYLNEIDVPVDDGPARPESRNKQQAPSPEQNQRGGKTNQDKGENRCLSCGKEGGLKCSRCKSAQYCSQACQRADWKTHKTVCVQKVVCE